MSDNSSNEFHFSLHYYPFLRNKHPFSHFIPLNFQANVLKTEAREEYEIRTEKNQGECLSISAIFPAVYIVFIFRESEIRFALHCLTNSSRTFDTFLKGKLIPSFSTVTGISDCGLDNAMLRATPTTRSQTHQVNNGGGPDAAIPRISRLNEHRTFSLSQQIVTKDDNSQRPAIFARIVHFRTRTSQPALAFSVGKTVNPNSSPFSNPTDRPIH